MRYWRGRQKEWEGGDGEGFVSQVRSWGGAVRVGVRGWWTGGGVPCGWGGVGELRGTAVVSRGLRLTGDITLRHGWRDRGTEGAMVIQAEKCQRPDTAVTHTHTHTHTHTQTHKQELHRHTSTQRSRTKESGVFESGKGWLQWAEMKRLHPLHLKKEEMRIKRQSRRKGKESLTILLRVNNLAFIHIVSFRNTSLHPFTRSWSFLHICPFSICSLAFSLKPNLIWAKLIKCPYCCSFDPIDLVFG